MRAVHDGLRCCLLFLALLCLGTASAAQEKKASAPDVDFHIVPETKAVEPGARLKLRVFISNKSAVPLEGVFLDIPKPENIEIRSLPQTQSIPPFGHISEDIELRPSKDASFGPRDLPFVLRFQWKDAAAGGESARQAIVSIEVQPPFSSEAKGLPGGTGALFALLLPVIPAFLAFQILDRWRTTKAFQMPTFSSDYVVPAFFIAILAKSLALLFGLQGNVLGMGELLVLSAALGAVWPLAHWAWDTWQWRQWGFQEDDEPESYLRKALLSPWAPRHFTQVTGTSGKEAWIGILLQQPDGSSVLGSELQITHPLGSKPDAQTKQAADALTKRVNEATSRKSRKQILQEIKDTRLKVAVLAYPKRRGQPVERTVVSGDEIEGFVKEQSERRDILKYSQ